MRLPNGWRAEEGTSSPNSLSLFSEEFSGPICVGDTCAGPGLRPATSSIMVVAKKMRSRLASSDEVEQQKADEVPITKSPEQAEKKRGKRQQNQKYLAPRIKHREVKNRLLSAREVQRFGTWNVRMLCGLGKPEQLASEMKQYKLSVLAVTETHISGEGVLSLEEEGGYTMLFSGRQDDQIVEGVGLALSPQA